MATKVPSLQFLQKLKDRGVKQLGSQQCAEKPCSSGMECLHLEEICLKVKFIFTRDEEEERVGGGTLVLVFLILTYGSSAVPCTCQLLA